MFVFIFVPKFLALKNQLIQNKKNEKRHRNF